MLEQFTKQRHRRHCNPFTVRGPIVVPHWQQIFTRQAPLAVDIGCGPGSFVCAMAHLHPEWNVVGIEIRPHLVEEALFYIKQQAITNAHAIRANANDHLPHILPAASVACLSINFPDPWYKRRHHKRRVISNAFLEAIKPALLPHAALHIMTDYEPIATHAQRVLEKDADFVSMHPDSLFATHSTTGCTSEREIKHQSRGETIYRLAYLHKGLIRQA